MNLIEELKEKWIKKKAMFEGTLKFAQERNEPVSEIEKEIEEAQLVLELIEITQEFKDLYETKGDHVRKVERMIDLNRKVEALGIIGF